jgi:type IVB pilus formation R64 PilN family outer membrane protein
LDGAIKTMLSAKGKVIVSPSTSSVTATDTPEVLKRVSEYIEMQNVMLSKQVMITVQVLQVSRSNNEDYSIKWDLVYADLARKYGLQNVVAGANGASQLTFGIIKPTSKWNGSTAMISALSTQGTVNLETSASVVALNNQPAPIQTGKQTVYLASSNTTQTTNAGTTTSLTPGTVSTGFSMHVLPSIMLDGTILLQFSADISTLRTIREVVGGDTKIEAPEVDAKSFLQRAKMKSGETLVLSGFEQTDGNLKNSGVGTASNWLAGGGMKAARSKDSLVILVTPVIVGS